MRQRSDAGSPVFPPPPSGEGRGGGIARLGVFIGALLLAACSERPPDGWSGYAEADYVYVAAPIAGTLQKLHVAPGAQVTRGKPLFELESEAERAAREEAEARLAGAKAQAANTEKGRRPPEVAVTQAQLQQARAQAELARRDLERKRELVARGFLSPAQMDEARSTLQQAESHVQELSAALQVAKLPSRSDEQAAAEAQVVAARQVVRQSSWREQQKLQAAPVDGVVSDTFFRAGEFVAAGQPVLSLLPPANLKARFFVPQGQLAQLKLGQRVTLHCDGCPAPVAATITRIATQPEYTPPVIYSNEQRAKLVFLVEARPQPADADRLKPGQPLDVRAEAAAR